MNPHEIWQLQNLQIFKENKKFGTCPKTASNLFFASFPSASITTILRLSVKGSVRFFADWTFLFHTQVPAQ
jgi:hypothetical protein